MADETPVGDVAQPTPNPAPLTPPPAPPIVADWTAEMTTEQPPPYVPPATPGPAAPLSPEAVSFDLESDDSPNFMVGLAAAVGLGLLAAIAYAVIAVIADREFAMLAVLIGIAVAFGFKRFGHTTGLVPGLVAAVVALGMFFVAIFLSAAGVYADKYGDGYLDSLRLVLNNTGLIINDYFADPLSYAFVGLAAIIAFAYASGRAGKKVGK